MVTVQVFAQTTGKAIAGSRVGVSAGLDGVYHSYTDVNGEAHFPTAEPGEAEVYVDGKTVFKGRLEGRKVVYI